MSYYDLQQFLGALQLHSNGLQRATLFRCLLDVGSIIGPTGRVLSAVYPNAYDVLRRGLVCESTRTPTRTFETTALSIYGYEEKYPVFTTYTDLECTFLTPLFTSSLFAGNGELRNEVYDLFVAWQSLIQNPTDVQVNGSAQITNGSMNLSFPDTYRLKDGMVLETIGPNTDDNARPTSTFRFFNVYPITVESAAVSWMNNDEIMRVSVTFAYSYWSSTAPTLA